MVFFALAICLFLAGCSEKAVPPVSEIPPSAPSEVESIIEPLEYPESASQTEYHDFASAAGSESEIEPLEIPAPESPAAKAAPANTEETPPQEPALKKSVSEPKRSIEQAYSQSEAPVALKSITPDKKLDSEKIESELLRLINALRTEAGVEALGIQEDMRLAARIRSAETLSSFSHTRPDGTPYNTAFDEAGFSYAGKWHGENLSSLRFTAGMLDEKAAALEMFTGLKDSPGHYQNMVGPNFFQAGIGVSISYGAGVIDISSAQLFSSL